MKLGISTACFYKKENVEDTFDVLRSMGVDVTEVFLNTFSEYEKDFVDNLVKRKNGVKVHSVHAHGTCFEPELFSGYSRIRTDAESAFRKVCYAGFVLGAKYYTFHGPFVKNNRPVNIDYAKFAERLNQLCDIAEGYGIQIAYENVNWCYFNSPDFYKSLKDLCPKLKATFDIKQAIYSDTDPYKILDAIGDRLVTVHVCDMDKGHPVLPPKGKVNFDRLFRDIYSRDKEINVLLEVYSESYKDYTELKESFNIMRDIMGKIN